MFLFSTTILQCQNYSCGSCVNIDESVELRAVACDALRPTVRQKRRWTTVYGRIRELQDDSAKNVSLIRFHDKIIHPAFDDVEMNNQSHHAITPCIRLSVNYLFLYLFVYLFITAT